MNDIKKLLCITLLLGCILSIMAFLQAPFVYAIGEQKVVRIGCYDLKSFVHETSLGAYDGYGVEYMNQLAHYTG